MGVDLEDENTVEGIDDSQAVYGAVRFLQLEPTLGPPPDLDLRGMWQAPEQRKQTGLSTFAISAAKQWFFSSSCNRGLVQETEWMTAGLRDSERDTRHLSSSSSLRRFPAVARD